MEQLNLKAMRPHHLMLRVSASALFAALTACTQISLGQQPTETPLQLQSGPALGAPATAPAPDPGAGAATVPTATPIAQNSAQPTPLESTPAAAAPPATVPPTPGTTPAPAKQANEPRIATASGDLAHGFYINVGVFAVPANADKVLQKLQGAGFKPIVQELTTSKGHVTRVRVGPFKAKPEAERVAEKIHVLKLDAVVFKH